MRFRLHDVIGLIVMLLFFIAGICGEAGAARQITDNQLINVGDAGLVNVQLEMKAGELKVRGEGHALLDAAFSYPLNSFRPEVEYTVEERIGTLLIHDRDDAGQGVSVHDDFTWVLALTPEIPMNLSIKMGAGEAEIKVGGMNLEALSVEMGAGDLLLDLTGDWKKSLTIRVKGGAGNLHLRLPKTAGVNVKANCGIGRIELTRMNRDGVDHFSNNAYGRSDVTIYIQAEVGVGVVHLEQER